MARGFITSQRAFPVVLALTLAAALLPARWLGWTRLPAEIVRLLIGPFGDYANQASAVIRPTPSIPIDFDGTQEQYIEHLRRERDEFERLFVAEQDKAQRLLEELEAIEKVPRDVIRAPLRPVTANIAVRPPGQPLGAVGLNRGSDHGVSPGTVAVYDGVNLVGRVTDDVSAVQSALLPLASPTTPPFLAVIQARDRDSDFVERTNRTVQVFPKGDGDFLTDVDRSMVVNEGDIVRLMDSASWPDTAQAMVVGVVSSVKPKDAEPLRNTILIRPRFQVAQIAKVVLKIEEDISSGEDR
jgi:cell shape-determining protein MreC